MLVFPYAQPRFAAVSGAVRVGLASGVPVLTTPTTWFSDLRAVTLQTDDLAGGIARLLEDTALRDELTAAARQHCAEHSWTARPGGTSSCTTRYAGERCRSAPPPCRAGARRVDAVRR